MRDGWAKWWASLPKDKKHARYQAQVQLMHDGWAKWWSNLTKDEKHARFKKRKDVFANWIKKCTAEEQEYLHQKRIVSGLKKTLASANKGEITVFDVLFGSASAVSAGSVMT